MVNSFKSFVWTYLFGGLFRIKNERTVFFKKTKTLIMMPIKYKIIDPIFYQQIGTLCLSKVSVTTQSFSK
jgi:hypothetical protein